MSTTENQTENLEQETQQAPPQQDTVEQDSEKQETLETLDSQHPNQDAEQAEPEQNPLELALAEIESLKKDNMRLMAEMENLRKRTQKELTDARKYAVSPLAKDLFTVSDNLGRALNAVTEEQKENADPALKNLIIGLEMIANDFTCAFDKNNIKVVHPTVGNKFDVNTMQAMQEIATDDVESGCVVQTLQPAYVMHERLLRPAMVVVAK